MQIDKIYAPDAADLGELKARFEQYARSRIVNLSPESADREFLFSARDGTRLVGGIYGNVYWNGLEIDILWVEQAYRGTGIGAWLLAEAEQFARHNGAVISFFKTVEAKGFYEKQGYQTYGILEDRPIGTLLYHMKKRLDE